MSRLGPAQLTLCGHEFDLGQVDLLLIFELLLAHLDLLSLESRLGTGKRGGFLLERIALLRAVDDGDGLSLDHRIACLHLEGRDAAGRAEQGRFDRRNDLSLARNVTGQITPCHPGKSQPVPRDGHIGTGPAIIGGIRKKAPGERNHHGNHRNLVIPAQALRCLNDLVLSGGISDHIDGRKMPAHQSRFLRRGSPEIGLNGPAAPFTWD